MMRKYVIAGLVWAGVTATASAQPAYKLGVKPEYAPKAEIKLAEGKVVRTAVTNDPGFRLLFHIKKDGKSVTTVEARSSTTLDLPAKENGTFSLALEQFFPNFKTGNVQKGEFKAISNVLTYQVDNGKVTLVEK